MKFSIFVSLLSFNLSVSPSPHTLSFSPVTDVILEKISSPLFEIKTEHGLYVWKIFMRVSILIGPNDTQIILFKNAVSF